jgi:hypothetical protein
MTDTDTPGGPLALAASFPPDERYVPTAADLAAKLAAAAGCGEASAEEVRLEVDGAFRLALAGERPAGLSIDVSFRTSAASFEAELTCGSERLLHCRRARSA